MKTALILSLLSLSQLTYAESVAFSIHAGQGFQRSDVAVIASAESIIGPSVFEVSAMFVGNPLAGPQEVQTMLQSVNLIPRIIIGYPALRVSLGAGCGIARIKTTVRPNLTDWQEHQQTGPLFLGVFEVRVFPKKGVGISSRVTMVRTRLPQEEYDHSDLGEGYLYTLGFVKGF